VQQLEQAADHEVREQIRRWATEKQALQTRCRETQVSLAVAHEDILAEKELTRARDRDVEWERDKEREKHEREMEAVVEQLGQQLEEAVLAKDAARGRVLSLATSEETLGQDLVKLELQLADCRRELSTAQSNGADAECAATASRDEHADILLALDNAKHETADGVAFIATLTRAQRLLEAEVEAAKAGWQAANYERDSCRQSCEAQVDSYKQQLQQSERQVQAVQSELAQVQSQMHQRLQLLDNLTSVTQDRDALQNAHMKVTEELETAQSAWELETHGLREALNSERAKLQVLAGSGEEQMRLVIRLTHQVHELDASMGQVHDTLQTTVQEVEDQKTEALAASGRTRALFLESVHLRDALQRCSDAKTTCEDACAHVQRDLDAATSQLAIAREETETARELSRDSDKELAWEREKACERLERAVEEQQERSSAGLSASCVLSRPLYLSLSLARLYVCIYIWIYIYIYICRYIIYIYIYLYRYI